MSAVSVHPIPFGRADLFAGYAPVRAGDPPSFVLREDLTPDQRAEALLVAQLAYPNIAYGTLLAGNLIKTYPAD